MLLVATIGISTAQASPPGRLFKNDKYKKLIDKKEAIGASKARLVDSNYKQIEKTWFIQDENDRYQSAKSINREVDRLNKKITRINNKIERVKERTKVLDVEDVS